MADFARSHTAEMDDTATEGKQSADAAGIKTPPPVNALDICELLKQQAK